MQEVARPVHVHVAGGEGRRGVKVFLSVGYGCLVSVDRFGVDWGTVDSRQNRRMSQFRNWSWWSIDVPNLDRSIVPGREEYLLDLSRKAA